jgi:hypothetical protein
MTLEALQSEIASLPDDQVSKLRAFLFALSRRRSGDPISKLTAKLDDPKQKWVSLEEAEKRLGLDRE